MQRAHPRLPVLCVLPSTPNQTNRAQSPPQKLTKHAHHPYAVVAVCGRARTGKSYILNQLLGQSSGFTLGHSYKPCTKGARGLGLLMEGGGHPRHAALQMGSMHGQYVWAADWKLLCMPTPSSCPPCQACGCGAHPSSVPPLMAVTTTCCCWTLRALMHTTRSGLQKWGVRGRGVEVGPARTPQNVAHPSAAQTARMAHRCSSLQCSPVLFAPIYTPKPLPIPTPPL